MGRASYVQERELGLYKKAMVVRLVVIITIIASLNRQSCSFQELRRPPYDLYSGHEHAFSPHSNLFYNLSVHANQDNLVSTPLRAFNSSMLHINVTWN